METNSNYIDILFNPNMYKSIIQESFNKYINFLGYKVKNDKIHRVYPIGESVQGIPTGLYSPKHYPNISYILNYLIVKDMMLEASLLFLGLCTDYKSDKDFSKLSENYFKKWTKIINPIIQ